MTNRALLETLLAQNEQILGNLESLGKRVDALEKGGVAKGGKKTTKKSISKKSNEVEPKPTREERLTEKFGDKATRTKFVELRKKVAEEFGNLAKANDCYIPKKSYMKVLTTTTESLNGKFNKSTVKKAFIAAAK